MSLTKNPKTQDIELHKILLEGVQLLRDLVNDPKALDKAAKQAHALPEAEQAKAKIAKETISANEKILANTIAQEKINEKLKFEAEKFKTDAEAITAKNAKVILEIAEKKKEVAQGVAQNNKMATELTKRESALIANENHFNDKFAELTKKIREVEEQEKSLKDRAAKISALTEGL